MKPKFVLLVIFLTACLTTWAWAQEPDMPTPMGGFYGTVTYVECTCDLDDCVRIQPTSGGDAYCYYLIRCGGVPGYTTENPPPPKPEVFPAGNYYISVSLDQGTDCDHSIVRLIQHGQTWQEVNLTVLGPGVPDP
jgi:hypothetical protein